MITNVLIRDAEGVVIADVNFITQGIINRADIKVDFISHEEEVIYYGNPNNYAVAVIRSRNDAQVIKGVKPNARN